MTSRIRLLVLAVIVLSLADPIRLSAQETGRWAVDAGKGRATASILSLNTLSTGSRVIDYHPILNISCDATRFPVWRQAVQIRDAVSGDRTIDVSVRLDNGRAFTEAWVLAARNRMIQFDGDEGVARLTRSRRLNVTWRFSLFSGRGEAVFSLVGLKETVAELAEACGASAPGRP